MIIIGEKVNGAIPSVAKATAQKDAEFIQHLAKVQADAGAHFIDVCAATDVAMELDSMKWLIDIVQAETTTPLAVDSPSAQICA